MKDAQPIERNSVKNKEVKVEKAKALLEEAGWLAV